MNTTDKENLINSRLLPLLLSIGKLNDRLSNLNIDIAFTVSVDTKITEKFTVELKANKVMKKEEIVTHLFPFLDKLEQDDMISSYKAWGCKRLIDIELLY